MAKRKKRAKESNQKTVILICVGIAALLLAVGAVVGLRKLWRTITEMPAFRVRPGEITVESPWVKQAALLESFRETDVSGFLSRECSIFTPNLTAKVREAYGHSPWVREVRSVRKVFPNALEVQLVLREPFAAVSAAEKGFHLLDRDGVILSHRIYRLPADRFVELAPVIILTDSAEPPDYGMVWDNVSVQGGLAMVTLCREDLAGEVAVEDVEIETTSRPFTQPITMARLQLRDGPLVEWGRVPSQLPSPAEVSTQQKISSLLGIVRQEGGNLSHLQLIDVRCNPPRVQE